MPAKELSNKLKTLPRSPGVYFHKSKNGEIIYVGKAAVLKNRVRQYFQNNKDFDLKTQALVAEIADTDWIETETEIDALFLESEMVKRYMPRFNILLRDDKSQIYIRINMKDDVFGMNISDPDYKNQVEYFVKKTGIIENGVQQKAYVTVYEALYGKDNLRNLYNAYQKIYNEKLR